VQRDLRQDAVQYEPGDAPGAVVSNVRMPRPLPLTLLAAILLGPFGTAAGQVVGKQDWVTSMRQVLPAAFCQEGTYFRSCFTQSPDACHAAANRATAACLTQFDPQIPAQLRQPADGQAWGQKLGQCAGTLFEVSAKKNRVNSAICNNPAAWK